MKLTDNFFKKVEKRTNINKDTILSLADKLKDNNMKNPDALKDVIHSLSEMTGKEVSKEKEDKIIKAIINDEVPDSIDKMYE